MCSVFKTLGIIFLFCTCLYIDNGEQTSSQRKSRCLSGKLHCLYVNFVFGRENETLAQSASVMKRRRCPFRFRCLRSLIKNWKRTKIPQQVFIRLHFVLKYIVYRLDTGRSRVAPYPLGIFFLGFLSFFLTSDLSSWASDLFHLLAHCLVSKKVSVKYCVTF